MLTILRLSLLLMDRANTIAHEAGGVIVTSASASCCVTCMLWTPPKTYGPYNSAMCYQWSWHMRNLTVQRVITATVVVNRQVVRSARAMMRLAWRCNAALHPLQCMTHPIRY